MNRKKILIGVVHVGYWLMYALLFFSFFILLFASGQRTLGEFWSAAREFAVATIPFALVTGVIGFYSAYLLGYNEGFLRRNWLRFIGLFLLVIAIGIALGYAAYFLLFEGFQIYLSWETFFGQATLMGFIVTINFIIGIVIKGFIHSFEEMRMREELHRRTTEVELELVKAHLQPHFLFNTINNIDAMLVKNPEQASQYLNKLSEILRYTLFETNTEWVPLHAEITYLNRYLELQAIRTHVKDFAVFSMSGDAKDIKVAPFIFMPFVENAFKHAARVATPAAIQMVLRVEEQHIVFSCINRIAEMDDEHKTDVGGIGNELMRKRLALIYGADHTLSLHKTDTHFHVQLTLKCSVIPASS